GAAVEVVPVGDVLEAVVGAAVEEQRRGPVEGGERIGQLTGGAVREGEDDDVVPGQARGVGGLDEPVGDRQEVGLVLPEAVAGAGVRGERADLDLGVGEEEAQDLAPGIPAGPGHGYRYSHPHNYTHE